MTNVGIELLVQLNRETISGEGRNLVQEGDGDRKEKRRRIFWSDQEREKEDGVEKGGKGGGEGYWEEKGGNLLKKENVTIAEQTTND